jgi:hypothetical protein
MKYALILLVLAMVMIGIVSASVLPKRDAEPEALTLEEMVKRHEERGDDDWEKGGGGRGGRGGRGGNTRGRGAIPTARGRGGGWKS